VADKYPEDRRLGEDIKRGNWKKNRLSIYLAKPDRY
jgi:hypothetical protein